MSTAQEGRDRAVAEALVALTDSLVEDYDLIELLHRLSAVCVDLLPVEAAGLLLSDQQGALRTVSSSTEQARLLELFELQTEQGPCLDCFRSTQRVVVPDLLAPGETRWPRFAAEATAAGFHAVHALPLRLRQETIGALTLFGASAAELTQADLRVAQALADVATIGILQERAIRRGEVLAEQLQVALNSRIVLEQAKGVLAERGRIDMDEAFEQLRRHARDTSRHLTDVARSVVDGAPLES